jgi:hypothetical protein
VIPLKQASEGALAQEAARRVRQAIKETVSRLVWLRLHLRPLIPPVVTQM